MPLESVHSHTCVLLDKHKHMYCTVFGVMTCLKECSSLII